VGHDPDFSEVLGEMTGIAYVPMRKGALARVDFEGGALLPGRGTLRFIVPPEILAAK
jgi:phosphohistidine phosphatase SixA